MAFCENCGKPVGGGRFCFYCDELIGNRANKNKTTRLYGKLKKRELLLGIVLIVLGLIIGENWGRPEGKLGGIGI